MVECLFKLIKLNLCSREVVFKFYGGVCGCLNRDLMVDLVLYYIEEVMMFIEEIGGIVYYIVWLFNFE